MDYEKILKRKLELLFPDKASRDEITATLDLYGTEEHEPEITRVKLAILKLCDSDLEKIKEIIITAKHDWRNILSWAEYPRQNIRWSKLDDQEREKIIQIDRDDYEKWLEE
jgi:hypothetical protein